MSGISKRAAVRLGGVLAGTGLLFVGGALVASGPAFADNGPHVSNVGNPAVGSTDGCAGCHRLHSGEVADYLLRGVSSETALCTSCHGASGTGATTDVMDGVAFTSGVDHSTGSAIGALRGGGFNYALLDASGATRGIGSDGTSIVKANSNIGVLSVPQGDPSTETTSKHDVGALGTQWGFGQVTSVTPANGVGKSVELECASCHDPHGNNSYRILKPFGGTGASMQTTMPAAITAATRIADTAWTTPRWTYVYSVAAADTKFFAGEVVAITGMSNTAYNLTGGIITKVTTTTVEIGYQATDPAGDATTGTMTLAFANNIKAATSDGTSVTYTTHQNHNMLVGQKITIAGATPTAFNLARAAITAVSTTTFTVTVPTYTTVPAGTAYTSGGYVVNIPDALPTTAAGNVGGKVYTQTNYWYVDDHYYTGSSTPAAFGTTTAFITNVSQWCSTCHTRYFAAGTVRRFDSGDATFKFRHTSASAGENGRNCISCHVAHGSNAVMDGQYSSTLPDPGSNTPSADSRLLRVSNRGICNMCHQNQ